MLGALLVPLSKEPHRERQPLHHSFGLESLTIDQKQQSQNKGHQVVRSHSPKDIQLLILVLWVMGLTEKN